MRPAPPDQQLAGTPAGAIPPRSQSGIELLDKFRVSSTDLTAKGDGTVKGDDAGPSSGAAAVAPTSNTDLATVHIEDTPQGLNDPRFSWRSFLGFMGTGLMMVVAYLDPGNLQADIEAGAETGFSLLWWFALVSLVCGTTFQCLSSRLGLVTGKDLAQHCGDRYPRAARWLLWLMIELAIISVDIQETVGCAQALHILSQHTIPLWAGCIIVSCTAFTLLLLERRGARWLEALFGIILSIEAVAMGINFFRAGVPAEKLAKGLFVPKLPKEAIVPAVGALGALVMPYNLYFCSSIIINRRKDTPTPAHTRVVLQYQRLENFLILLGAFIINMFIICVFAWGFYGVPGVSDIGLEGAGELLGQRFGVFSKYCWAAGLFASGQVATIALTYAGQLIMSGLLRMEVKGWMRMSATRMVALVPALTVALISNSGSNKFDRLNQLLNVVQSIQLPFAMIPVIHMTASRQIMGNQFVSPWPLTLFCGLVATAVVAINGYLLVDFERNTLSDTTAVHAGWPLLMAAYFLVLIYYGVGPERVARWYNASPLAPVISRWSCAAAAKVAAARQRAASGAAVATSAAASAGKKAVGWAKGIDWRDPESMLEVHI